MSKRIASKAKAKRALRKGHSSSYKSWTRSKNKGNVKRGAWAKENPSGEKDYKTIKGAAKKYISLGRSGYKAEILGDEKKFKVVWWKPLR